MLLHGSDWQIYLYASCLFHRTNQITQTCPLLEELRQRRSTMSVGGAPDSLMSSARFENKARFNILHFEL